MDILFKGLELRGESKAQSYKKLTLHYSFKDEAQTALFKDPVHTAL
jgi:hypothetical protein